jgi:hypothetical protein
VSHKGFVSKPPVPEEREANRLHGEAVKKKKDTAKQAIARKRERKEEHERECRIALAEGRPRPVMPESTVEEDSSDMELNFLDDDKAATRADSPPAYMRAVGEGSSAALGEARLTPGSLVNPPPARTERRSLAPATSERTPVPTTSGGGSAVSAGTPLGQSSGGVIVPRFRRSSTGKRNMSARVG